MVVFPAPAGPNRTKNSLSSRSKEIFLTAVVFPYVFVKFSTVTFATFLTYPFTAPKLSPRTRCFWMQRHMIISGMIAITDTTAICP